MSALASSSLGSIYRQEYGGRAARRWAEAWRRAARRTVRLDRGADFDEVRVIDIPAAPCPSCGETTRAVYLRPIEDVADQDDVQAVYECVPCGATEAW